MSMLTCKEIKYHFILLAIIDQIDIIKFFMKTALFIILALLAIQASSIPWKQQIALVNSLQVGREEDPMTWSCVGCD